MVETVVIWEYGVRFAGYESPRRWFVSAVVDSGSHSRRTTSPVAPTRNDAFALEAEGEDMTSD